MLEFYVCGLDKEAVGCVFARARDGDREIE